MAGNRSLRTINWSGLRRPLTEEKKKELEKLAYMWYMGKTWKDYEEEFQCSRKKIRRMAATPYFKECITRFVQEQSVEALERIKNTSKLKDDLNG